jgi:pimeloyl-ACP methyl ester carboxylesterase
MDLPGFGATPAPNAPIGAREYASLLVPVLDEFGAPPLVVGHSFGGRVAVCLAAEHPGRVAGLVVTGAPLLRLAPGKNPPLPYRLARRLNKYGLVSDESMEAIKKRRGSADYRAASGVMRDILVKVVNEEYRDELSRLADPIHLLWGADDAEVPVAVAHESAILVNESGGVASLEVVEGVGHMLPIQDPDSLRVAVAKMLR